ncbi:YncE family protein [Ochrovirga pacifica]|uniref:YncE family protein n=1 Tax=Ochrovirga pacifica TaxID=1042376 RepID=UPI000255A507|nr:DUF5074 domain-containing protein [Ochrovirga pacifica]
MKITKLFLQFLSIAILVVSCQDDDSSVEMVNRDYSKGVLISGEGSSAGTGSISYVATDRSVKYQFIYLSANGVELGTFLQSIAFTEDNAYLIVDNANTVTMVDKATFIKKGEITTGLQTPRYMTVVNNNAYVSNWGDPFSEADDFIAVVDLTNNSVVKKIAVSNGPEQVIAKNGKLYVSHKGAYTYNNVVSVIDLTTDVVTEIEVEDNPDEMFFNNNGNLVVLSEGRLLYNADYTVGGHTIGAIQTIDIATNTVSRSVTFEEGVHPSLMAFSNDQIFYYTNGNVYKIAENATSLATEALISKTLSGMAVSNNELHGVDAGAYKAQGDYYIYDLDSGEEIYTSKVALGAAKIYVLE